MEIKSFIKPGLIAVAIVLTALILASSFKNRNAHENSISVVGLGTTDFTSDQIRWSGNFSTKAPDAKTAYSLINTEKKKVKDFFLAKGFLDKDIHFTGVEFDKNYRTIRLEAKDNDHYDKTERIFDGYTASQGVYFSAKKNPELMQKIEKVSQKTAELINKGIEFNAGSLRYTYSALPSLKHDLIEKASQDANARAGKIVSKAKSSLGNLKNASMGVFQITGKGEDVEDTYGGNFDTHSKEKTARITVRLAYVLD